MLDALPPLILSRSICQSSWTFNVFLFFFFRCFAALLCTKLWPFLLFSIDVLYVDDERKSRPIQLYQCDPSVKGRHQIESISMVHSVQTKTSIYYQNSDAFFVMLFMDWLPVAMKCPFFQISTPHHNYCAKFNWWISDKTLWERFPNRPKWNLQT